MSKDLSEFELSFKADLLVAAKIQSEVSGHEDMKNEVSSKLKKKFNKKSELSRLLRIQMELALNAQFYSNDSLSTRTLA